MQIIKREFANVADYYRMATGETDAPTRERSSRNGPANKWNGDAVFDDTCQRYLRGYPELTAKAKALSVKLTPFLRTVKGMKRGFRPSMHAGGNFIIDNYNRGIPEACLTMQPVISKKFASILVNNTASAGIDADVLTMRGVAATALVDILQANGYRVAVKLGYGILGGGYKLFDIITLKAFEQTMELDRLAFFLADPSAFRRLQFSAMETHPKIVRDSVGIRSSSGYGRPIELDSDYIGEKDIYLGCASFDQEHWHTLDTAQAWIKEALKRYGVQFYG